ncbi:hypothetical protein [Paenibacillus sp. NFR01]|uniref:hypothetical protein n=1 Tax=Paenibacillus sp. NFR01 TaxID=1566279 RepID=UPI0008B2B5F0|nr:hypothetical protein [Paenibacillus sp. NFR01]SET63958.1 Cell division protein FtsL [Paenibacillus sp. NFR01]
MAYTRGNLATQPRRKQEAAPLYREKTKVVTRRKVLPVQEKLLYMLTVAVFALMAALLVWRYVHIYDLNMKAQSIDQNIAETKKQIATFEMKKQVLEQTVVQRAKEMGYQEANADDTIHISGQSSDGDN